MANVMRRDSVGIERRLCVLSKQRTNQGYFKHYITIEALLIHSIDMTGPWDHRNSVILTTGRTDAKGHETRCLLILFIYIRRCSTPRSSSFLLQPPVFTFSSSLGNIAMLNFEIPSRPWHFEVLRPRVHCDVFP